MSKSKCTWYNIHDFYVELYGVTIWFADGISGESLVKLIKSEFDMTWEDASPGWVGKCLEVLTPEGKYAILICLKNILNVHDAFQMGTLGHEVFHAAEYLMGRIGTKHCEAVSEPWAYLIGYIQKQCLLSLTRKGRRNKNGQRVNKDRSKGKVKSKRKT